MNKSTEDYLNEEFGTTKEDIRILSMYSYDDIEKELQYRENTNGKKKQEPLKKYATELLQQYQNTI